MTRLRKLTALALVVVMISSLCGITSLADNEPTSNLTPSELTYESGKLTLGKTAERIAADEWEVTVSAKVGDIEVHQSPVEIVFVVDTSGSMAWCTAEEHGHSNNCYGYIETDVEHTHDDDCYTCGIAYHAHNDNCFVCGETAHSHGAACCSKEAHTHVEGSRAIGGCYSGSDAFGWTLRCEKTEHSHDGSDCDYCSEDEHTHDDVFCGAKDEEHLHDACAAECGIDEHTHIDVCKTLLCEKGVHTHSTSGGNACSNIPEGSTARMDAAIYAIKNMVDYQLPANASVTYVRFSDTESIIDSIDDAVPTGGTYLTRGVSLGLAQFSGSTISEKVLIIVADGSSTDGYPHDQLAGFTGAVYPIGFHFSNLTYASLARNGGKFMAANDTEELTSSLEEVAAKLYAMIVDPMGSDVSVEEPATNNGAAAGSFLGNEALSSLIKWTPDDAAITNSTISFTYTVKLNGTADMSVGEHIPVALNGTTYFQYGLEGSDGTVERKDNAEFPIPTAKYEVAQLTTKWLDLENNNAALKDTEVENKISDWGTDGIFTNHGLAITGKAYSHSTLNGVEKTAAEVEAWFTTNPGKGTYELIHYYVAAPEIFNISHDFISATAGKALPASVTEHIPADFTEEEGKTVHASDFSTKSVSVPGGTWKFISWEPTSKVLDGDFEFVGAWIFIEDGESTVMVRFVDENGSKIKDPITAADTIGASYDVEEALDFDIIADDTRRYDFVADYIGNNEAENADYEGALPEGGLVITRVYQRTYQILGTKTISGLDRLPKNYSLTICLSDVSEEITLGYNDFKKVGNNFVATFGFQTVLKEGSYTVSERGGEIGEYAFKMTTPSTFKVGVPAILKSTGAPDPQANVLNVINEYTYNPSDSQELYCYYVVHEYFLIDKDGVSTHEGSLEQQIVWTSGIVMIVNTRAIAHITNYDDNLYVFESVDPSGVARRIENGDTVTLTYKRTSLDVAGKTPLDQPPELSPDRTGLDEDRTGLDDSPETGESGISLLLWFSFLASLCGLIIIALTAPRRKRGHSN